MDDRNRSGGDVVTRLWRVPRIIRRMARRGTQLVEFRTRVGPKTYSVSITVGPDPLA